MRVVYFHRKRSPGNYSIESVFEQVRNSLPDEIQWQVKELSRYSTGFFNRLFISLEAMRNQATINHVTGDVNFITLFLNPRRTVLTVHDVGLLQNPSVVKRFILLWFWIKLPVRFSKVITTVSEATKKELLKYVSVEPSRIRVVYVPISPRFKRHDKVFNKDNPIILQVGTKFNKNLMRLIEALRGVKCRLNIVGDVTPSVLEALVDSGIYYKISSNISQDEMLVKYAEADIISFVSTYEGFGMPIIEANTVGRVVVTSNILSMPEIGADAAHFVDPFDVGAIRQGILKVITDDEYRQRLIENGFKNRLRFEIKSIVNNYVDIYRSI